MTDPGWRWFYLLPGAAYANGPTTKRFCSEREARAHLRDLHHGKLPRGTEVWKASRHEYGLTPGCRNER